MKNKEAAVSTLYIYCDAAKETASASAKQHVLTSRQVVKEQPWCGNVIIIERENNFGLAASVIDGVSSVIERHGSAIVLEDDLEVSPFFLQYMNEALEKYRYEEKVISIHGYTYPVKATLPETFFLRGADCWGWATWKRGWELFEKDGSKLLREIKKKKLHGEFNFNHTYDYVKMLQQQVAGKNSSWAVRWYASAFLANRLTLYAGKSLVQNIGTDATGTHVGETEKYVVELASSPVSLKDIPIEHNDYAYEEFVHYFRQTHGGSFRQLLRKIKYILPF